MIIPENHLEDGSEHILIWLYLCFVAEATGYPERPADSDYGTKKRGQDFQRVL